MFPIPTELAVSRANKPLLRHKSEGCDLMLKTCANYDLAISRTMGVSYFIHPRLGIYVD